MDPILVGFVVYLVVVLVVGVVAYRRTQSQAGFILGDRKLGPWVIAFSERASGESAWLLVGLWGPAVEEIFFRGFLFKGLKFSKIGPVGAVLLTSLAWAMFHTQYDLYGITTIFVGGLILGLARLQTNSVYIPLIMHSLWNFIATMQCIVVVAQT